VGEYRLITRFGNAGDAASERRNRLFERFLHVSKARMSPVINFTLFLTCRDCLKSRSSNRPYADF
jgi:hypothetical protein